MRDYLRVDLVEDVIAVLRPSLTPELEARACKVRRKEGEEE